VSLTVSLAEFFATFCYIYKYVIQYISYGESRNYWSREYRPSEL
jgi:hypothetical protein